MICFTTILPYLNKLQSARKTGVVALLCAGLILSYTHTVEVAVLGADIYGRSTFPLFLTISKVNIADFLQRLDAIVILTLIIGAFFKCAIYCYAAVIVAADLFRVEKQQKLVLPIGITILFSSIMVATNWADFVKKGSQFTIHVIEPFLCVVIPVLLLAVHLIRKRFSQSRLDMQE